MIAFIFFFTPLLAYAQKAELPEPSWTYVEKRLLKNKFKLEFIEMLKKNYESKHFVSTLELNVLLFLRKSDYHGPQISRAAKTTVKDFMRKNRKVLKAAEQRYGVPASVVASLLWLESRHGSNPGQFHVPSAYLHLVQAPRLSVQRHLQLSAKRFASTKVTPKQREEIRNRTHTKAAWALKELRALQTMYSWNRARTTNLRGSFAGAFGIPQFIPSSYVRWSRAPQRGQVPNLELMDHAIFSVAFYLLDNGWVPNQKKTHIPALMKYNNSRDYAEAILKLAKQVVP